MGTSQARRFAAMVMPALLACVLVFQGPAAAQQLPAVDAVIGNNFGHLPMFVGVEKGFFKKHGVDVAPSYLADVEKAYPEYFNDLPALPR